MLYLPSIIDISQKTGNGDCCLLLDDVPWWIHEQPGTWRAETLEGVSVSLYLTCIVHLSLQATISIIYRPPVVSSCLSAFSVTFKHFVNEFYKELAPEGRWNKKQALWVGSGAMCVQHHELLWKMNVYFERVKAEIQTVIFPSYLTSAKLHALSLTIR